MTIYTKAQFEKEISDALSELLNDVYYGVRVKEYHCDKNYQSSITLEVQMYINGDIEDLPSDYIAPEHWSSHCNK